MNAPGIHTYDRSFFEYINAGSRRSAQAVLPFLASQFDVNSVADFGAGQGAWLAEWQARGVTDIVGIDGSYVDDTSLLIPPDRFLAHDLKSPIALGRRFDLVESVEVAEHLPASAAETFIANLVSHGDLILFSAAVPGQGGEHHVNEQPYEYWRQIFASHGYVLLDAIRPRITGNRSVEPWYRYNTLLYVHHSLVPALAESLKACLVAPDRVVPDVSPWFYRLRKHVISWLPLWASTRIAVAKKHLQIARRRLAF